VYAVGVCLEAVAVEMMLVRAWAPRCRRCPSAAPHTRSALVPRSDPLPGAIDALPNSCVQRGVEEHARARRAGMGRAPFLC
jgi:hypothetical protein